MPNNQYVLIELRLGTLRFARLRKYIRGRPAMRKLKIIVNDLMQKTYIYYLTEPVGENFHPEFKPDIPPKDMLAMGVFGGRYMTDCRRGISP